MASWAQSSYYPGTTLDNQVREADRALRQYDEQVRQKAQYDADLAQLRARYEEELAHQRAVTYLDPYGIDRDR